MIGSLAVLALSAALFLGEDSVRILPDDPQLAYSEYVRLSIDSQRARFDRGTVDAFTNNLSPGARINFRASAEKVKIRVRISDPRVNLRWFRLEIDGEPWDEQIGGDMKPGFYTLDLFEQESMATHDYSLILPHNAGVELFWIDLYGDGPELYDPPARPSLLYVAYGDSITHGNGSSDISATYPARIGALLGFRTINMGFSGRAMAGEDGLPVAALGADIVSVLMGRVDFTSSVPVSTYAANLNAFLDDLRSVQPDISIVMTTPTWTIQEQVANSLGYFMNDYRQAMRSVVAQRAVQDPALYLMEGLDLITNSSSYFIDGVHPTDAGFIDFAHKFVELDHVRDGSFEQGLLVWDVEEGQVTPTPASATGTLALALGPDQSEVNQRLYGMQVNQDYQVSLLAAIDENEGAGAFGVAFFDSLGMQLLQESTEITTTSYGINTVHFTVPAGASKAILFVRKTDDANGLLYVDDVRLLRLKR